MTLVLVLDAAQNYPSAALEELRRILGPGGCARRAFALILLGDDYPRCRRAIPAPAKPAWRLRSVFAAFAQGKKVRFIGFKRLWS